LRSAASKDHAVRSADGVPFSNLLAAYESEISYKEQARIVDERFGSKLALLRMSEEIFGHFKNVLPGEDRRILFQSSGVIKVGELICAVV
jgi:hypothetical protein